MGVQHVTVKSHRSVFTLSVYLVLPLSIASKQPARQTGALGIDSQ